MKKHLIQAAERGDAEAQFNLAIMYENGALDSRYTNQGDAPEALRWLVAAAHQGLPRAQIKLAERYAGEVEGDSNVKACAWYLLAAAKLSGAALQKAQSAYQRASSRLTPVQLEEVRRFADDWKPTSSFTATIPAATPGADA